MPELQVGNALASADDRKIVDELRAIAQAGHPPASIDLVKLALMTRSPQVRNEAALTLLALGHPRTAELMITLIARGDTRGARGTLLYVLAELGESVPVAVLVDIIIEDGYEAREEAVSLLRSSPFEEAEWADALAKLRPLKRSKDKHLAMLAAEVVELLTQR